ncbi:hypothetical protein C0Q70_06466 [Pomacea canaliculata]|uniref:Uncharacterized protein n=1 Tax=Pomacea canaliculata TaxID=400727 RepID=A0A2T7PP52_POMCA|nr:hypothetical protein C0Q70_06466 [Pomacea canaliculata]
MPPTDVNCTPVWHGQQSRDDVGPSAMCVCEGERGGVASLDTSLSLWLVYLRTELCTHADVGKSLKGVEDLASRRHVQVLNCMERPSDSHNLSSCHRERGNFVACGPVYGIRPTKTTAPLTSALTATRNSERM